MSWYFPEPRHYRGDKWWNAIVGGSYWGISGNWHNNIGAFPTSMSCFLMYEYHVGWATCSTSLMLLLGSVPCWNIWMSAVDEFWQVRRWLLIWNGANQRCLRWSFYKQPQPLLCCIALQSPHWIGCRISLRHWGRKQGGGGNETKKDKPTNRSHMFSQQFVSAAEGGGYGVWSGISWSGKHVTCRLRNKQPPPLVLCGADVRKLYIKTCFLRICRHFFLFCAIRFMTRPLL